MSNQTQSVDSPKSKFHQFLETDASGGVLLIICTIVALLWANSSYGEAYEHLLHTDISFKIGNFELGMGLLHWINDGLMAIFFFVVGLEIKREVIAGELSSLKKSTLPALGAIGGMLVPALLFVAITVGKPGAQGWGIPMATDIAFSLGILSLLGKRVPLALKVFLTALAIVDDLGAILVIAIFYTEKLEINFLIQAFAILSLMLVLNWRKVRKPWPYIVLGIFVWYYFLLSGIHATIAGVLIAFTLPSRRGMSIETFNKEVSTLKLNESGATAHTICDDDIHELDHFQSKIKEVMSPGQRLEHAMHSVVNYFIMPVFALANAGVHLGGGDLGPYIHISLGVAFGLLAGKTIGISFLAWLGTKLNIAELPNGTTWIQMIAVAMLGGLGFTMSLFISNLAYQGPEMVDMLSAAKIGVLGGSVVSGIAGYIFLSRVLPRPNTMK